MLLRYLGHFHLSANKLKSAKLSGYLAICTKLNKAHLVSAAFALLFKLSAVLPLTLIPTPGEIVWCRGWHKLWLVNQRGFRCLHLIVITSFFGGGGRGNDDVMSMSLLVFAIGLVSGSLLAAKLARIPAPDAR